MHIHDKLCIACRRASSVRPDGAAAAAGLFVGDEILGIDGLRFRSLADYRRVAQLLPRGPHAAFALTVRRGAHRRVLPLEAESKPPTKLSSRAGHDLEYKDHEEGELSFGEEDKVAEDKAAEEKAVEWGRRRIIERHATQRFASRCSCIPIVMRFRDAI